jgi:uncharacterized protein with PIN domain/sulfur carrier protein ThiS
MKSVTLRFYEELNDFLPASRKKQAFEVNYNGRQTVKDIIESNGVPHIEVDLVLVNGKPVDFGFLVQDNDKISVYPVFESFNISSVNALRNKSLRKTAFILDVHLGRLKKYLRWMGFDTLYRNDYKDEEIVHISNEQHRIILTRDVGILKRNAVKLGYWVRNIYPRQQAKEVIWRFDLYDRIEPFKRCPECNGIIEQVAMHSVIDKLQPGTRKYYHEFWHCTGCEKIYWKGSHYKKLNDFISEILSNQQNKHS